jgi:hypothetical protein
MREAFARKLWDVERMKFANDGDGLNDMPGFCTYEDGAGEGCEWDEQGEDLHEYFLAQADTILGLLDLDAIRLEAQEELVRLVMAAPPGEFGHLEAFKRAWASAVKEANPWDDSLTEYFADLSERLRNVPVMYGVDGADIDRLAELSGKLRTSHPDQTTLL